MPLIQVLSGAIVALIGSTVSPWVGASNEQRRWVREKFAQAAEQYVAVLTEAEMNLAGLQPGIDTETFAPMQDINVRLRDAASGMRLYAPREIRVAAMDSVVSYNLVWMDLSRGTDDRSYAEHRKLFADQAARASSLISRKLGAD
jgi:hypothetical protein